MWPDTPEHRLMIIEQRHAELAREAAAARMARRTPGRDFSGLRIPRRKLDHCRRANVRPTTSRRPIRPF